MGRRFAILGDIHSNLEALNVVLDDCRSQGVTDFLCTGDVVGYNACPKECLEIVRSLGCPVVKGGWSSMTFAKPMPAVAVRLQIKLKPGYSSGICELRLR